MKPKEITAEMRANHFIEWFEELADSDLQKRKAPLYAAYVAYQIGQTHPLMGSEHSNFMANYYARVEKICKDKLRNS